MLEIPESKVISGQLEQTIKGKVFENVYANLSPHAFAFYFGDPSDYDNLLSGKRVDSITSIAGQIEIIAGDMRLLFNDGTNIRYLSEGDKLPVKHQLYAAFEDGSSIVCTIQMYGGIRAFHEGESDDNFYYTVAKEKPSPLSDEFNEQYFQNLMNTSKQVLSVKAFLATEQRIPGLGNGVLQDILFNSKIHPKTKIQDLNDAKKEKLFNNLKRTLFEMTINGGRDTEKDLFGCVGGYKTLLSNKTFKNPCHVCGDTIIRQAYLGGNIYFCPTCQPL